MDVETIQTGFEFIRNVAIITDRRILKFDKQGATAPQIDVNSICLDAIYHVTAETAGGGYITTSYMKAHGIDYDFNKLEARKK